MKILMMLQIFAGAAAVNQSMFVIQCKNSVQYITLILYDKSMESSLSSSSMTHSWVSWCAQCIQETQIDRSILHYTVTVSLALKDTQPTQPPSLASILTHLPLVLAPAEGLGALRTPCQVGVIYFNN